MPFDLNSDWHYRDCFTIDPLRVERVWEKLDSNQLAIEIGHWPRLLHNALIETLKERNSFDRNRHAKIEAR